MSGAESVVRTLTAGDVNVCFANPGTSEMHFIAALDRVEGMRCVLGLFEGVVTGAADGYGRMMNKPAATLLHLGPGLANGLANLHNARRASTPLVNIVGDHATYHGKYNSPLTSDVEGVARPFSDWLLTTKTAASAATDTAAAIAAARTAPGRIATLILPTDTAWGDSPGVAALPEIPAPATVDQNAIESAALLVAKGPRVALILGSAALRGEGPALAGRIAAKTGVRLISSNRVSRMQRGAGSVPIEGMPYAVDAAVGFLSEFEHLILVGSDQPVAFFAYPGKPSLLTPEGCGLHVLAAPAEDVVGALAWLCDRVGANKVAPTAAPLVLPSLGQGVPTAEAISRSVAALMPEGTIVVDESVSSGRFFAAIAQTARPHDFLKGVGGAIGFGLPAAIGAAIACPDRPVLCLEADGSAMYTVQALWTQAREKLNIVNVIFANRAYAILRAELKNVGAPSPGPRARDMLEIDRPEIDWCAVARGLGVAANRATDMETFNWLLADAFRGKGPSLIEVVL